MTFDYSYILNYVEDKNCAKESKMEEKNYVDLSNKNLNEIPELENIECIEYLFLNDNKLINIDLKLFINLKVLDISNNLIEELLFLPPNLVELVCEGCNLKYICPHENITILHCENNKLTLLESYPQLEDLQCDDNQITTLKSMNNLRRLICRNNPIDKIDLQQELSMLDCSCTNINNISFAPNVVHLMCNKSKILDLTGMNNIINIEICDTQILDIPYLENLENLIFNNKNINISPKYKIKNVFEYDCKIDAVFDKS
jgi:hypothetical protein